MKTSQNTPGAIVLGGNFVGLGIVRSLAAHGIPVWVIDADCSKSIAQFSKHTKRFIELRDSVLETLLREGKANNLDGWVLYPVTDEYVEMVSDNYEILSSIYRLTTPTSDITRFALDKRLTYSRADDLGIAAPWTVAGESVEDLIAHDLRYPLILKPAVNHHFFPHTNVKALLVEDQADLRSRFAQMNQYIPSDEILAQERIPGGGDSQFSYCAACTKGKVYATLVAQRGRQYPLEFGNASSFVETANQPVVAAAGQKFLESLGLDGVAEVEFKFDCRDGKYKILDVNLRLWGWHTLGKAAGIDFSYLLWRQKVGFDIAPVQASRNAAWLREITDVLAIIKSPDHMREIKRTVRALRRGKLTLATFDLFDPVPFFAEFALFVSAGRLRQKKARDFVELNPGISIPDKSAELASKGKSYV